MTQPRESWDTGTARSGGPFRQDLAAHCDDMFRSLPRSDQRRSSEIYVAGLLRCPGKKSIRRIASQTSGGYSDQSLQQFVNQSGWDPGPVRRLLATRLCTQSAPKAWVVDELAFPKHGRSSAGVERQYVAAHGRLGNCQLGVFVALAGELSAVPVNWRLTIPRSWDADEERRTKARIPDEERHRPYWRYQVEALDDLAGDWGVAVAPAVLDVRQERSYTELVQELDNRSFDFLIQVNSAATVRLGGVRTTPVAPGPRRAADGPLAELAAVLAELPRRTVAWVEPDTGLQVRAQFTVVPVVPAASAQPGRAPADDPAGRTSPTPQVLIVEWGLGRREPRAFWLSNMVDRALDDIVGLSRLPRRVGVDVTTMIERFGLCDYEGRSFLGWHHHVTLASIAYAFHLGAGTGDRPVLAAAPDPAHPPEGTDHDDDRLHPGQERASGVPGPAGQPAGFG